MTGRPTLAEIVGRQAEFPFTLSEAAGGEVEAAKVVQTWCEAAPLAAHLLSDGASVDAIGRAWATWRMGLIAARHPLFAVSAGRMYGESRGRGRRDPGFMDRVQATHANLLDFDGEAYVLLVGLSCSKDPGIRSAALRAHQGLAEALRQYEIALEALDDLDRAMQGLTGGKGSLTEKQAFTFMDVAKVVADQWRRLGIEVPAGNSRDGGLVDLLDALHREAGAGPLTGIPALMAALR